MRKVLVIAAREYRAAVKSKAFIISLLLMPILMGASIGIQVIIKKLDDKSEKHYAVIDRTPGHRLFDFLEKAVENHNQHEVINPKTKKQDQPTFKITRIESSAENEEAVKEQQYELSKRVEKDEFQGFLDVGAEVYKYNALPVDQDIGAEHSDAESIRYQTNKPTSQDFYRWVQRVIPLGVEQKRFEDAHLPLVKIKEMQQTVPLKMKGLSKRDPVTSKIEDASDASQVANFLVPAALIGLMFTLIMIGATPAMQGVVEEKMQRIAEVLLGSVSPFQLMMGKLGGMIGVSLTVAFFYLVGALFVAHYNNVTEYLSLPIIAWFVIFQVLAILMFGSLFIAIGAAATDMKETQSLMMPVMIIAVLPMLLLGVIIQEPNSTFATLCSFFPPSTPMLMTARLSVPPGIPLWQPLVGIVGVLATTLACVYAAGRIFRVGILLQGKGAKYGDLVKWVVRG